MVCPKNISSPANEPVTPPKVHSKNSTSGISLSVTNIGVTISCVGLVKRGNVGAINSVEAVMTAITRTARYFFERTTSKNISKHKTKYYNIFLIKFKYI